MIELNNIHILAIALVVGCVVLFVYAITITFSTKSQIRMLKRQLSNNVAKDGLQDILSDLSDLAIKTKNSILEENGDMLRDIATKEANISKDAITIKAKAVKEGFGQADTMFCKHCGENIDSDSKFCKKCGQKI